MPGTPVDATGQMPDGSPFEGVTGLRAALLAKSNVFVATLTERLLVYALGRGLEHYDTPAVRVITRTAADHDNAFSSLILGIVNSVPFRMRAAVSAETSPLEANVASR